ncbi:DUF4384 domain-containing protein [Spirosoma aureum]|uniref:DUF4384 domain-containing protein n=1 Tax=Spirosoma aureum TaxID=2692134 RepID=A0A6G9ASX2_9BACT|nr:DUF4384 domain-containing protein [Spirosoma aureum]QIP15426.1 DUF4384 domain-containing protein [Spirosoma aureum]
MKTLLWFTILLSAQWVWAQAPADLVNSGLRFDDEAYLRVEQKPDNVIYKAPLPRAISYEKYLPDIERQGDYGTCVAFTCAYYTRTAIEAIQRNLTTKPQINQTRFSPTYLYSRLKLPNDVTCQQGGTMDEGLLALKNYGAPFWSSLPYPQCIKNVKPYDSEASQFRIRHFERVFDFATMFRVVRQNNNLESVVNANIQNIKRALAGGYPVPIGMMIPLSFQAVSTDTWTPAPSDVDDLYQEIRSGFKRRKLYGHALTVVGYDDNRQAFRVVNSWGTRWADNGLCWIKYRDFVLFTRYAFRVYPMEPPTVKPTKVIPTIAKNNTRPQPTSAPKRSPVPTTQPDKSVTMQASVEMRLVDGSEMPARRLMSRGSTVGDDTNDEIGAYKLVNGYASGTRFKLTVNNDKAAYVYVIGTDQSMKLTRLFPYADSLSAMIDAKESAVLPGPTKHIRLDNNPGQEYYLVLFADKPLDMSALMTRMSAIGGSLSHKITQTLGDQLMDWHTMNYDPVQITFSTATDPIGKVVPVLISLDHKP